MAEEPENASAGVAPGRWFGASQRYGYSAIVLLAGLGATFVGAYLYYAAEVSEARERFSAWCEERQEQLSRKIDAHIEVLHGVQALFDSSEFVSPQEFDRFTRDALKRHEHIRSLDFLRQVTAADRTAFEASYAALLGSGFSIKDYDSEGRLVPAPSRPLHVPLLYTQPHEVSGIGVDAGTRPDVAAAMSAARERNAASALFIEQQESPGEVRRLVHVYLPVHAHSSSADPAGAVSALAGYVRVQFVLEDILEDALRQAHAAAVEIDLIDGDPSQTIGPGTVKARVPGSDSPALQWSAGIQLADRTLSLRIRTTADYAGQPTLRSALPLLLAGLVMTLLGAAGTYYLARSRIRSQELAERLLVQIRERRQSEARYQVLVENSPDAILLYLRERVVFVNRAALRLFGALTQEELLGRGILDLVHSDYQQVARERIARMHRETAILPALEQTLLRLDGSTVEVEILTVPFMSDDGLMLQVTARDITERRKAERERQALESALRQSQRLEAIGTLTGGIAHDFNNILSSIVGNIQLLLQDLPEAHPAWRSAQEIRSATHRARDLVKRLMAFSRQQETARVPIDLAPLIAEVQLLLRPALPAGIALLSRVPPDTPAVMADATQLHQVLVNLCTNAWQSMSSGQGTIEIVVRTVAADDARRQSQASLQGVDRYVCIEVRDNGSGIAPEFLDRIFEPFFTTKPAGEGSGLGLATVHGIVQSHHGAIGVSSRLGAGTIFSIYLPASDVSASPIQPAQQSARRGGGQHVLYVDDEEPLVFLVKRMLERSGYRCTGETDPRAAIATFRRDPSAFDLVLTDMNMPGMSGIDVAREVLALRPDLPVVITTGYVRAADVAVVQTLGVRGLILKPDTIEELSTVIGRYLEETARPVS